MNELVLVYIIIKSRERAEPVPTLPVRVHSRSFPERTWIVVRWIPDNPRARYCSSLDLGCFCWRLVYYRRLLLLCCSHYFHCRCCCCYRQRYRCHQFLKWRLHFHIYNNNSVRSKPSPTVYRNDISFPPSPAGVLAPRTVNCWLREIHP